MTSLFVSELRFAKVLITARAAIVLAFEREISCVKLWIKITLLVCPPQPQICQRVTFSEFYEQFYRWIFFFKKKMSANPPSFKKKLITGLCLLYVKELAIVNIKKNIEIFDINYHSLQICLSHSTQIFEKKLRFFIGISKAKLTSRPLAAL